MLQFDTNECNAGRFMPYRLAFNPIR